MGGLIGWVIGLVVAVALTMASRDAFDLSGWGLTVTGFIYGFLFSALGMGIGSEFDE